MKIIYRKFRPNVLRKGMSELYHIFSLTPILFTR